MLKIEKVETIVYYTNIRKNCKLNNNNNNNNNNKNKNNKTYSPSYGS